MRRIRDLMLFDDLVIACDSCGGIGPKEYDSVAVDAVTTAHFALRVPLLEVLCSGARPMMVIDTLCVEMDPTGRAMIDEMVRLAGQVGIPGDAVGGSTEENVPTRATGVGTVVLGRLRRPEDLLSGGGWPGDAVLCLGLPVSAPDEDIFIGHPQQVSVAQVQAVAASGLAHDMLPVGSRGLAFEVPQLAASAGLDVCWEEPALVARQDSGGPASAVLVSCAPGDVAAITQLVTAVTNSPSDLPVHLVARLA
ncbi:transcriptional regulator [Propionibacterium sp.]|uniref:transcriptional regulator n=1 Tax=Propionibacterium sp. TaxID=1977903 RepID=UPI0039EA5538